MEKQYNLCTPNIHQSIIIQLLLNLNKTITNRPNGSSITYVHSNWVINCRTAYSRGPTGTESVLRLRV